jgi:lysophospholipase L1-like esterase
MVSTALASARTPARSYRLGVIGTSLVQQNDVATSGKVSHWSRGWLSWARVLSKGIFNTPIWFDDRVVSGWEPSGTPGATRYFTGLNAGVSGQTTAQIWERRFFLTNTVNCDIIVIDAGTNDVASYDKEYVQSYREALADFYLSRGKLVILLPILARGTSVWAAGVTERKKLSWINNKSIAFCRSRSNCFYFDWNKPWINFQASTSGPISGYSPDDLHFAPKGGYAVGKAFAEFLATILPPAQPRVWSPDDLFDSVANPLGNLITNPFLLSTTGTVGTGVTGTVASSMRVERNTGSSTAVASKETRADGLGEYQVVTFTQVSTGENLFYFRTNAADTPHSFAAGSWVQASCEVDLSAYAGWTGATLYLKDMHTDGLIAYAMEPFNNGGGNDKWTSSAWKGQLVTPAIQLKSGSPSLRWRLEIRFDAGVAGSPIIKIGAVEMRQVADPREVVDYTG